MLQPGWEGTLSRIRASAIVLMALITMLGTTPDSASAFGGGCEMELIACHTTSDACVEEVNFECDLCGGEKGVVKCYPAESYGFQPPCQVGEDYAEVCVGGEGGFEN